jgi:hypothetical protein
MTLLRFTSRNLITDRWLREHPNEKIECWGCGRLIEQLDPRQKYCNNRCKKRAWRAAHKTITYRNCAWCSKEFIVTKSTKIYCSKRCIHSGERKRKGIPVMSETKIKCGECTIWFIRHWMAQKYCTFECFYIHKLRKSKLYRRWKRGSKKTEEEIEITEEEIKTAIDNMLKAREEPIFSTKAWSELAKESDAKIAALGWNRK